MAKYKETTKTITQQQRCYRVVFELPYIGTPSVQFLEEMATDTGGVVVTAIVSGCDALLGAGGFKLRDPQTDALQGGTMKNADLLAALYSLYRESANARDALIKV